MASAELVGPFRDPPYRVVVDGYLVPHLEAGYLPECNQVFLHLDGRIGLEPVSREEYERWMPFIAHCMAVAAGYSCFGKNSVYRPNPYKHGFIGIGPADLEEPPLGL